MITKVGKQTGLSTESLQFKFKLMAANSIVQCDQAPEDSISHVQFLKVAASVEAGDVLVSSWDSKVRLYNSATGRLVSTCTYEKPILASYTLNPVESVTPHPEHSSQFVCGGLSGEVYLGDFLQSEVPSRVLGQHDAAVSCISYCPEEQLAYSGGWDKQVKAWDIRAAKDVHTLSLTGKVFGLAVSDQAKKLVICDSQKTVSVYDIRDLTKPESVRDHNQPVLKYQLRDVVCFPDGTGYSVASVEGRVAWEYFDQALGPTGAKKNYAFKCHREKAEDGTELIYPVNALAFNSRYHSFATGGGDATVSVWDGYNKKRLWKSSSLSETHSVSSLSFNVDGTVLAIGLSNGKKTIAQPRVPAELLFRTMKPEDVTPKTMPSK